MIVVGGGQAGLAMGAFLREQDVRFAILDAADAPAAAWRARWVRDDARHLAEQIAALAPPAA